MEIFYPPSLCVQIVNCNCDSELNASRRCMCACDFAISNRCDDAVTETNTIVSLRCALYFLIHISLIMITTATHNTDMVKRKCS